MSKKHSEKNQIQKLMEGRAARICVVAVSAFLCLLTLIEFSALSLELEVPVLDIITGSDENWSIGYQKEEIALDDSRENIILEEATADKSSQSVKKPDETVVSEENTEIIENMENTESTETQETAAEFPYYIRINRKQNCITVFSLDENGEYTVPCKAIICSTGLYNATPRGTYHLSTKYLWRELYGGVYGQYATRITGGILFHSVPYYKKTKDSLCTDKYNKLGQQASMGCVRLTVEDAKWIADNCPVGTAVEIYDDDNPGPLGKPEADKIDADSPNKGWDPTDPDEENPWHAVSKDW